MDNQIIKIKLLELAELYNEVTILEDEIENLTDGEILIVNQINRGVHINWGIHKAAALFKKRITKIDREDNEYPIEQSFKYKDYLFYQIDND